MNRNISSQNSNYHNLNPLVSDVNGLSQHFDEHELQKLLLLQEANARLSAAGVAASTSIEPKPGNIVDRVKDELHKTVQAKRKLLEKNFINFRFDEFKKEQLRAKLQLEEHERQMGNGGNTSNLMSNVM